MANKQTEEIKDLVRMEMEDWAASFIQDRVAFLRQGVSKSGILTDSMSAQIDRQARQEAVEMVMVFSEHGRYIDMRTRVQDKWGREAIVRISDWVGRVGLEKFLKGWIKTHGIPNKVVTDEELKNRIAWGIVKRRAAGKYRRRRWWNKSKQRAITELFNQVAAKLPPKVSEQMAQTLKTTK